MDHQYNIQLVKEIGFGAFSTVYKAINLSNNQNVAVKVIGLEKDTSIVDVTKEVNILSKLKHPNIINIIDSMVHDRDIWLVMPLSLGSVKQIMTHKYPEGFKDECFIATIIRETLKGLEYIHKEALIHRDIKADNILISESGEIKISDFGIVGDMFKDVYKTNCKTFTGTVCWMSPEMVEQRGHNYKTDIWSLGITTLELGYGYAPYSDYIGSIKPLLSIIREEPPTYKYYGETFQYSRHFNSFVEKCLKKDSCLRVNATKMLSTKLVKKAKTSEYIRQFLHK